MNEQRLMENINDNNNNGRIAIMLCDFCKFAKYDFVAVVFL